MSAYHEALARCEALGRAKSAAYEAWQWSMGCWDEEQYQAQVDTLNFLLERAKRDVRKLEKRQKQSVWSTEEAA